MKQLIYMIFITIFMSGCAIQSGNLVIKQTPYSLEDVEKHHQLFKSGKHKSLNTLIEIYQDRNQPYDVRMASLKVLAESDHPNVMTALTESVETANLLEMDLLLESVKIVVEKGELSSTKALVGGLAVTEDKIMTIRESIVDAIGRNGSEDEILTLVELYEVSLTNHARMNELLTLTLGAMDDDRSIPILMEIAQSSDINIRTRNRAVEILSRKNAPELVDFFVEMMGDAETNEKMRHFALDVMDGIQEERMVLSLLESYQAGKKQYYAMLHSLMNSLTDFENPAIKPALLEVAKTEGYPKALRIKAIRGLANFDDPDMLDEIVAMLEIPENYIYFSEIINVVSELGQYEQLKPQIRMASYIAMQNAMLGGVK
jgi:HEAT repeat protein